MRDLVICGWYSQTKKTPSSYVLGDPPPDPRFLASLGGALSLVELDHCSIPAKPCPGRYERKGSSNEGILVFLIQGRIWLQKRSLYVMILIPLYCRFGSPEILITLCL
jgi:hypothetical protein